MKERTHYIKIHAKDTSTGLHPVVFYNPDYLEGQLLFAAPGIVTCKQQMADLKKTAEGYRYRGIRVITAKTEFYVGNKDYSVASHLDLKVPTNFDVNQRLQMVLSVVEMIISNLQSSLVICGRGGTGKTYSVMQMLEEHNLKEVVEDPNTHELVGDYKVFRGGGTPVELYRILHDYRDKLIIFDDYDTVLQHETSINFLKAVLDTDQANRRINYDSPVIRKEGLDSEFSFTGRIIFISNRKMQRIPQPLASRSMLLDLNYTDQELIDRAESIQEKLLIGLNKSQRREILNFIKDNIHEFKEVSLRTFVKAAKFYLAGTPNWKQLTVFAG